jgi:hypothetical protein
MENADKPFTVEAKSQSSSRSFLDRAKAGADLSTNYQSDAIGEKSSRNRLNTKRANYAGFIFPRMCFWIPFPQRTG